MNIPRLAHPRFDFQSPAILDYVIGWRPPCVLERQCHDFHPAHHLPNLPLECRIHFAAEFPIASLDLSLD